MEYIAQRMHPGVVLCLRKIGYTPSQAEGEGHTPGMRAEEEKKVGVKTEAEPTPIGMVRQWGRCACAGVRVCVLACVHSYGCILCASITLAMT